MSQVIKDQELAVGEAGPMFRALATIFVVVDGGNIDDILEDR